jgi:hypothetical protein
MSDLPNFRYDLNTPTLPIQKGLPRTILGCDKATVVD